MRSQAPDFWEAGPRIDARRLAMIASSPGFKVLEAMAISAQARADEVSL